MLPAVSTYLLNLKSREPNARKTANNRLSHCIKFLEILGQKYSAVEKVMVGVSSVLEKIGVQIGQLSTSSNSRRTSMMTPGVEIDPTGPIPQLNNNGESEEVLDISPFQESHITGVTNPQSGTGFGLSTTYPTNIAITPPDDSTCERVGNYPHYDNRNDLIQTSNPEMTFSGFPRIVNDIASVSPLSWPIMGPEFDYLTTFGITDFEESLFVDSGSART